MASVDWKHTHGIKVFDKGTHYEDAYGRTVTWSGNDAREAQMELRKKARNSKHNPFSKSGRFKKTGKPNSGFIGSIY